MVRCPECQSKGRRHLQCRYFDDGSVGRIYRCSNPDCGLRYTTMESVAKFPRAPRQAGTKLVAADVADIKRLLAMGLCTQAQIARYYGVTDGQIGHIATGLDWGWVQPSPEEACLSQLAIIGTRRSREEQAAERLAEKLKDIEPILRECRQQGKSVNAMRRALYEAGFKSKSGNPPSLSSVQLWLKRLNL